MLEFIRGVEPPFSALLGELADAARLTQWEIFSIQAGVVKGARAWRARLHRLLSDHEGKTKRQAPQPTASLTSIFFFY